MNQKLTEKQAKFENEAQMQPNGQKNRSDNRITNIATLDNGTMVEVFKYLKYCGLAKTSLVSKRFSNLIRTHRHKLARIYVYYIGMTEHTRCTTGVNIFDKTLSTEEYNNWIIHNGYSKQIPPETQIAGMKSTQNKRKVYRLYAYVDYYYKKPKSSFKLMFDARKELNHENWPVFQHFFRLLTDPFTFIRSMELPLENDALNFLAGAINPDCGRIQCHKLTVYLQDNEQYRIDWIKGHVHCDHLSIGYFSGSNYDKELLDLFMTGANCTSKIELKYYDPCKVIGDFVQKFINLKSSDEDKVVGFIECHPNANLNIDALKRDYADFVVEENVKVTSGSWLVFEFVNSDIGKKLRLNVNLDLNHHKSNVSLNVANM
ncbi:hypothetical protein Ddc_17555 [Ditylenchus destructor]|nr:hypothetical protein Ddc_17555 [Ditylenchus destructor]